MKDYLLVYLLIIYRGRNKHISTQRERAIVTEGNEDAAGKRVKSHQ